jgi:hypothetical protein
LEYDTVDEPFLVILSLTFSSTVILTRNRRLVKETLEVGEQSSAAG